MNLREQFEAWYRMHPASQRYSLHLEKEKFDGREVYQWHAVQLAYDAFCAGFEFTPSGDGP